MTSVPIHDTGALFQIAEPTEQRRVRRRPGRGIGIDLGTTNSLVALAPHGAPPRVLRDSAGDGLVPSVVAYTHDPPLVGRAAQALQPEHPTQVVSSVKRFMGRGLADVDFTHPYHLSEETPGLLRIHVGSPSGSRVGSPSGAPATSPRASPTRSSTRRET